MDNSKGNVNFRNSTCPGRQPFPPPRSPVANISPSYADIASSSTESKGPRCPRERLRPRQRRSSESFLFEEQPSWLDELLNEPEAPVRRGGHRRSSSDSFAYLEASNNSYNVDDKSWEEFNYRNATSVPSRDSLDFERFRDVLPTSSYAETSVGRQQNIGWESTLNSMSNQISQSPSRDNNIPHGSGSSCVMRDHDGVPSVITKKQDRAASGPCDLQGIPERGNYSHAKPSASDIDTKRAKQQFAQQSRVRKLQYIAELERAVQAMQAEACEMSAELEFLGHQNAILGMENNALKQRLDSLAQEQHIKYFEQELLEGEAVRLRAFLYQQQQQPQPPPSSHHRRSHSRESRDLDTQFASFSLRNREC